MPKAALMTIEARGVELVATPGEAALYAGPLARVGYLWAGLTAVSMAAPPLRYGLKVSMVPGFADLAAVNILGGLAWFALGGALAAVGLRGVRGTSFLVPGLLATLMVLGLYVLVGYGATSWNTKASMILIGATLFSAYRARALRNSLAEVPGEEPLLLE